MGNVNYEKLANALDSKKTPSSEEYSEGPDSTFTHMGKTYSVDKLLALTKNTQVVQFPVANLNWMIEKDYDEKRVSAADTTVPVIIYKLEDGTWVTMDGYHRTVKAIRIENKKTIPAKIVTEQMFKQL